VIIIIFLIRSLLCKILTTEKESYFRNQYFMSMNGRMFVNAILTM